MIVKLLLLILTTGAGRNCETQDKRKEKTTDKKSCILCKSVSRWAPMGSFIWRDWKPPCGILCLFWLGLSKGWRSWAWCHKFCHVTTDCTFCLLEDKEELKHRRRSWVFADNQCIIIIIMPSIISMELLNKCICIYKLDTIDKEERTNRLSSLLITNSYPRKMLAPLVWCSHIIA
jgi:hypothetical protein